ncbi:hypothetical protein IJH33_00290 [Candidatus Saccharibacteria bacterium]|nr:hypothetical protein [Candidatus Saccharibacteria bacterium]
MTKGARNLVILGVSATIVALGLTATSLAIYHYSGDIYLDRSRPGYLPDKAEVEKEEETLEGAYSFDKSGVVTEEALTEYLEKIEVEVRALDDYQEPFSAEALSDERLGI